MLRPVSRALRRPGISLTAVAGLVLAGAAALATPSAAMPGAPKADNPAGVRACAALARPGQALCQAVRITGGVSAARTTGVSPASAPSGFGPADILDAYKLPVNAGAGSTLAVVDAQDDPNAESDMAVYRAQFGLSACTVASGCFKKVSQTGSTTALPTPDAGWAEEESLDLDAASAIAPAAHLILVEANSATMANLGTAVNRAVAMGATSILTSFATSESSSDTSYDSSYFNHPGVAISAPGGDSGFGVSYPAASRYVTAVGSTSLSRASTVRGWKEVANGGGGCSAVDAKPTWQHDTGCARRTVVDVAAVGDPATGFAVYDTYGGDPGWEVFGGTSVSAGIIAGVYAAAGVPSAGSYPASFPYAHPNALNDITTGTGAAVGYDPATGMGTPNGLAGFTG